MIRNKRELNHSKKVLKSLLESIEEVKSYMVGEGLSEEDVEYGIKPIQSFIMNISDEIESYERAVKGVMRDGYSIRSIGNALIEARIASGLTQRDLSKRLGIAETVVSRWEKNEYYGISTNRLADVSEAIGVRMKIVIEMTGQKERAEDSVAPSLP